MPLVAGRTPYLSLLKARDIAMIKKNLSFVGSQLKVDGTGTSCQGLQRTENIQRHLKYFALTFRLGTSTSCEMEEHQRQHHLNKERQCFCSAEDL